jgi:hypothetical protein
MKKGGKIIIGFYIFLFVSFCISIILINSTFEELPEITNIVPKKITELEFETDVAVGKKDFFNVITNVEEYVKVLPSNIISVKIIEKKDNMIIAEEEFSEAGIKIKMLVKHSIVPYEKQTIEILDGDAKGTTISQIFTGNETSTKIYNKIEFKLKGTLSAISYLPEKNLIHAMGTSILSFEEYAKGFDSEYEKIVDNLYRDILKRPADKAGLQHYSSLLESEEMGIDEIKKNLLLSYEAKFNELKSTDDLQTDTKEIINQIYIDILKRKADERGLSYFGALYENGYITVDEIKNEIYNSEEGANSRINTSIRKSIDNIHLELFDMHIDQELLIYYEGLLASEKITLDEIREELLSKIDE